MLASWIKDAIDTAFKKHITTAVVTGTEGSKVYIRRLNSEVADTQAYVRSASYSSPVEGDVVLVVKTADGWWVVDKRAE